MWMFLVLAVPLSGYFLMDNYLEMFTFEAEFACIMHVENAHQQNRLDVIGERALISAENALHLSWGC